MVNVQELQDIANILRSDVLKMTTAAGSGHPTSCLSCAEIISVLYFNEMKYDIKNYNNINNDEFILSKGHAAPILYSALYRSGCIDIDLQTLRQLKSPLEGHPIPRSLKWIKMATGSLGQGLSIGIGMAIAAKKSGKDYRTYVLLGDSETAEGSVWESIMLASYYKLNNICAIFDINRLGQSCETMLGHNVELYKKRIESFGWKVIIINGHDIKQIINAFSEVKKETKKPIAIIAKTYKGKGVSFLENKEEWHGKTLKENELQAALKEIPQVKMPKIKILKPKNFPLIDETIKSFNINYIIGQEISTREAYGKALLKLAQTNKKIIALDAEVKNSTYSNEVYKNMPERFIESYIAEQNMTGIALGLSSKGNIPFSSTFAAFFTRAHDQIRMAAISNANITFVGSHCGVSIGEDGPSQMGLEDISLFRCLPSSIVFYPSDGVSTEKIVELCGKIKGLKYIRTTRGKTPIIYSNNEKFPVGQFKIFGDLKNAKVLIVGAGITLHESLKSQKKLKDRGINSVVLDCYCVKPFDIKKFSILLKKCHNNLIISEDHYLEGGIGELILSSLNGNINIKHLYIKEIPHSGTSDQLINKYEINEEYITKSAKELLKL